MSGRPTPGEQGEGESLARNALARVADGVRGLVGSQAPRPVEATRRGLYERLRSALIALQREAWTLSTREPNYACEVATSDPTVLAARPGPGAEEGWYRVGVRSLANRHQIASRLWPEATAALGLSGEFLVDDCVVAVRAQDSLLSLRDAIGRSNPQVHATLRGSGPYQLLLGARRAGPAGRIALVDANRASILTQLGFLRDSANVKHPFPGGARSDHFPSADHSVGDMLDLRRPPRGLARVGSRDVTMDLGLDSLASIAERISGSRGRVRARVCRSRGGAAARYRLEIRSCGEALRLRDSGNVLHALGLLDKPLAHELRQPTEAEIVVDGRRTFRSTNTIARVIPGAVLTLVSPSRDQEVLVCVRRGEQAMLRHARRFAARFNEVVDALGRTWGAEAPSGKVGRPLEEPEAAALARDLAALVDPTGPLAGVAEVGLTFDPEGRLSLDEKSHRHALAACQGCWPQRSARAAAWLADLVAELLDPVSGSLALAEQALSREASAPREAEELVQEPAPAPGQPAHAQPSTSEEPGPNLTVPRQAR